MAGIGRAMPATAALYAFSMFAALGISPFLTPDAKPLALHAAIASGLCVTPALMVVANAAMAVFTVLAVHGVFSGLPGLGDAALGLAGCFIVFLIPHLFGVLGAGDVKLMATAGAGLGSQAVVTLVLFTSVAGGVQFLVWMAWARFFGSGGLPGYRLCYGPAIALGALAAMALRLAGQPYLELAWPGL